MPLRCAAARPADFLCLAKESQQRNATPRRRRLLVAGRLAAGLKTRCAQTIKPLSPPSHPAPAAAPKGGSGCFVVIECAKGYARKPSWIGRFRVGASGTLINKRIQGRGAGDALFMRDTEHHPLKRPKYVGWRAGALRYFKYRNCQGLCADFHPRNSS